MLETSNISIQGYSSVATRSFDIFDVLAVHTLHEESFSTKKPQSMRGDRNAWRISASTQIASMVSELLGRIQIDAGTDVPD